jgi:hypothetical protein
MSDTEVRVPWEVAEVGSTAVLLSTLILVLGGLASGLVATVQFAGSSDAVDFGAQWADPLLAMILLGLVGLSWWQHTGWMGDSNEIDSGSEVAAHLARFRKISFWGQLGLLLTVAGSASYFGSAVATDIGFSPPGPEGIWSQAVFAGASFLAVTALAVAGLFIGQKLRPNRDVEEAVRSTAA